ncbi:glycosyltransferase [Photobacterium phosphoreum]|uniref:glycosyltransferase n=1 Tax=Photobacterium phosphoreum TaxID=659 RepID=UPI000D169F55|nr:glycosyltransferase [Photobacterium phosphoreum]PTB32418.1 glycosyl transferase [Photobacterium phosphoreum]
MKILLVITGLGMGGAENLVVNLADKYVEQGHEVVIAYAFGDAVVTPKNKNIKLVSLGVSSYNDFFSAYFKLRTLVKKFQPDVIHSHMIHANLLARLVRLTTKIPRLVCTAHSTNEGGPIRMFAYKMTDKLADIMTNVSEEATNKFIELGAVTDKKITTVLNGIDTNIFIFDIEKRIKYRKQFKIDDNDKLIVAVGSLNLPKDYPNLLNAISIIVANKLNVKIKIIGDGPLKDDLLQLVEELNLTEIVEFVGISRDVPGMMSASDLFVLSSSFEGFGLVVAEAMSCERPVVVTDCGGVKEVVGDIGKLVVPENSDDLAKGIIEVLGKSEQELQQLGTQGRQRILDEYSLDYVVEKYMDLYSSSKDNENTPSNHC